MALTYSEMDAIVKKRFIPVLVDNVYIGNPLLVKLQGKNKIVYSGGLKIAQPILYQKLNGGSYRGLDPFNITKKDTKTLAEWDWKFLYTNFTIVGTDWARAQGDEQILDMAQNCMQEGQMTLDDMLSNQIITGDGTGNGGKDMDGLVNAIDNGINYGTYGGITYSDMPDAVANTTGMGPTSWQSYYVTSGGAVTVQGVKEYIGKVTFGTEVPDLLLTTQEIYDKLWGQLQPQQRYLDPRSTLGQAGFTGLQIDKSQILVDRHVPGPSSPNYCATSSMFGINTNFCKFVILKNRNFFWTDEKTPIDADGYVRQLLLGCNLIFPARRYHFQIRGFS